jgi:luciferase family oxidoreductase group 1
MALGLPLSILDLVPLGAGQTSAGALAASRALAVRAEALGYTRIWYAEHHNMPGIATTSPELLIAHVAPSTTRIRLGAGGVMLPNHSPLKVAESYRLLEAMHPGRIDLGLGRAPGTDGVTALALRRSRQALSVDDFDAQLAELVGYDAGSLPPTHPFARIRAMPDDVRLPPLWLLGSSGHSARLAAELGLPYAFAGHFSPDAPEPPMLDYRERFVPGALERPYSILALGVYCADSDAEAERLASSMRVAFAQLRAGRPGRLPSPDEAMAHRFAPDEEGTLDFYHRVQIVGTPDQVRREIEARARRTAADEVMIATHAWDPAARQRSYELIAGAFAVPLRNP